MSSYNYIVFAIIYPEEIIQDVHKNTRIYIILLFAIARNWEKCKCPPIKDWKCFTIWLKYLEDLMESKQIIVFQVKKVGYNLNIKTGWLSYRLWNNVYYIVLLLWKRISLFHFHIPSLSITFTYSVSTNLHRRCIQLVLLVPF